MWAELLGIDDKGVYKTTKKDKYQKGDPKGGKLKARLVKFTLGGTHPVNWATMPSFLLYEARSSLPIQFQALLSFLSGELDGFDAITRGLGFLTQRTFPDEKEIEKPKPTVIP